MEETKKRYYSWEEFDKDVKHILRYIRKISPEIKCIYAIPKGGLVLGVTLANHLKVPLFTDFKYTAPYSNEQILVVDDISDTGDTLTGLVDSDDIKVVTLFVKSSSIFPPHFHTQEVPDDVWVVYPWEKKNCKV